MEHEELTEKIIGCAFKVYNAMGYGYLESVYENCIAIELKKANISFERQQEISVSYEGEDVGNFIADLIINDTIIIELKSIKSLAKIHEIQLVNYLVATGKPFGLLINFGEKKVEIKRKFRDRKAVLEIPN